MYISRANFSSYRWGLCVWWIGDFSEQRLSFRVCQSNILCSLLHVGKCLPMMLMNILPIFIFTLLLYAVPVFSAILMLLYNFNFCFRRYFIDLFGFIESFFFEWPNNLPMMETVWLCWTGSWSKCVCKVVDSLRF